MAEELELVKISELPETLNVAATDVVPVVQNGTTKKASLPVIRDYVVGELGSAAQASTADFEPVGAIAEVENQLAESANQQNERIDRLEFAIYLIQKNGVYKAYRTKAEMLADKANIPVNSVVSVTNDDTNNSETNDINGEYHYNGTDFLKLPDNLLTQLNTKTAAAEANAKSYADVKKAEAIQTAAFDAQIKADEAKDIAIALADTQMQKNRKLIQTMYSASVFSLPGLITNTGTIETFNTYKRTGFLQVRKDDVIDYSLIVSNIDPAKYPLILWFDTNKDNLTAISSHTQASSSTQYPFRNGSVLVPNDGYIVIQTQGSPQSYTDYTQQYFERYVDEKLFIRAETLNKSGGVLGYDKGIREISNIEKNRKYTQVTAFTSFYIRNSNGILVNDNSAAYSDYIAVKTGDVINLHIYVSNSSPVVVWCDPTKTTFSRLDAISSTSTVTLVETSIEIIADGFITVNTKARAATDNYFYAYFDEKLFLRAELLNASGGVQSYDLAQKQNEDISKNRAKETRYFNDLVWSGGNGTDLVNDGANAYLHSQFMRVKKGDIVQASLIRRSDGTSGYIQIYADTDRTTMLERVTVNNIDATTRIGTLTKTITQDGWIAASTASTGFDTSLVNITTFTKQMYLQADRKTKELTVFGDSLSQGMQNAAKLITNTAAFWDYKLNEKGVGGENIFDTSLRSGAVPLWIKGGFTIPALSSEYVNIEARWGFNEQYSVDSSGNTVVDSRNITSLSSAVFATIDGKTVRLDKASNDNFGRAQWRIRFNSTQSEAYTVTDNKLVFADGAGQKAGVGMLMMGTNGGMFDYGQNINDRAFTKKQLDELVTLFQRNMRLFTDQKLLVWGYHGVFTNAITDDYGQSTTARKYFRLACQKAFGEKFIDMAGYLIGKGLSDLKVTLNSDEIAFIQAQDGVTSGSGGNSFLPLWSGDSTHPRNIVYQAMMNQAFDRMYKLGWLSERLQIPITFIMDLSVSALQTNINIGNTTTATASYTDPANNSDIFNWTSSNPAVAIVTNNSWVNNWSSAARRSTTITGVAAGIATITCTCRYGGASTTFDITVN